MNSSKFEDFRDFLEVKKSVVNHLYSIADKAREEARDDYAYSFENIASMIRVYQGEKTVINLFDYLSKIVESNRKFNFSKEVKDGWRDAIYEVEVVLIKGSNIL